MSTAEEYLFRKEKDKTLKSIKKKYYINSTIFIVLSIFVIIINEKFIKDGIQVFLNILSFLIGTIAGNKIYLMEKLRDEYWNLKGSDE